MTPFEKAHIVIAINICGMIVATWDLTHWCTEVTYLKLGESFNFIASHRVTPQSYFLACLQFIRVHCTVTENTRPLWNRKRLHFISSNPNLEKKELIYFMKYRANSLRRTLGVHWFHRHFFCGSEFFSCIISAVSWRTNQTNLEQNIQTFTCWIAG